MRHKTPLLALIVVLMQVFASCAPDPIYSYPPEYEREVRFTKDDPKTITLDNQDGLVFLTNCQAGDSITALIRVTYTGAYITKAIYHWTLRDAEGEKVAERKIEQLAPHRQSCPPMWTFMAPTSGTYTMHFRADFKYSASDVSGAISGGYPTLGKYEDAGTVYSKKLVVR